MSRSFIITFAFSALIASIFLAVLLIAAAENPPIPEARSSEVFTTKPFNLLQVSGENYQRGEVIPIKVNWLNVVAVYLSSTVVSFVVLNLYDKTQRRFVS